MPLNGYALYTVEAVRTGPVSAPVFAGVVFAVTAAVAAGYASLTGLSVPRYATVLALQPVLPLLVHDWIVGPTGWALALSGVAALDIYLGRQLAAHGRLVPPTWTGRLGAPRRTAEMPGRGRPEAAPEEDDVLIGTEPSPVDLPPHATSVRTAATARWLRELTWVLHGLAVGAALIYGVAALVQATTVPAAVGGGATLLIAAGVGLTGALVLRRRPLPDVAGGVMTLAVIGAASRVAAVALPGRALIVIAATITIVAFGVRSLPASARRGPQLASTAALLVIGVVVAGAALRAAVAPVRAAYPTWEADLQRYPEILADAVGPAGWQLAVAAALLTIAAVLAATGGGAPRAGGRRHRHHRLAAPASFGLPWSVAPWPPVIAAIGIGVVGLWARTPRAAQAHVARRARRRSRRRGRVRRPAGAHRRRPLRDRRLRCADRGHRANGGAAGPVDERDRRRVGGRRRRVRVPGRGRELRRGDRGRRARRSGDRPDPRHDVPGRLRDPRLRGDDPGRRAAHRHPAHASAPASARSP